MKPRKDKGRIPEDFVWILHSTIDSRAWRAMSHGARSLYLSLSRRYSTNFKNNGKLYLSTRNAAKETGSGLEEIGNWFRELQHYGFIVQTQAGCLGVEGHGLAPHWRLTAIGYMNDPPTRDFLKWDGTKYRRRNRSSRRAHGAAAVPAAAQNSSASEWEAPTVVSISTRMH
jgi:hypothetical protein